MASRWQQTGSPLRPLPEDADIYHRFALEWMDRGGLPRILLLGVTPEIYRIPWPQGHTFTAVDGTPAMIDHIWPGGSEQVLCADWRDLPFPAKSFDLAFCDGGLHLLSYPEGQARLVDRLADVIAPGGRCIFRLFVPPENRESPEAVLRDLLAGGIENVNILKLRLGMSLQKTPESGTAVSAVWKELRALSPDWKSLADRLQWDPAHLEAIDSYRDSAARYHFVSIAEAKDLFCQDGRFSCPAVSFPTYRLGERCPFVVFERKAT